MNPTAANKPAGSNFFEDFHAGRKMRHPRGVTVGEVENQMITKLVMNTADVHFNEDSARRSPFGQRVVFGLVTASIVIGLATQDTAESALAELGLDQMRFRAPVYHGDTLYALTEVLETRGADQSEAGVVRFKHWGINQDGAIVFESERSALIKRRPVEAA
ncbi:MAG: MaoC family dehydratase [Candidatus Binataceae bacterium]